MKNRHKRVIREVIQIIVVLAIIFGAIYGISSWYAKDNYTSSITVISPESGINIYVDNELKATTEGSGEITISNLDSGSHTIITSDSEGSLIPWSKTVRVAKNASVTVKPFLLPYSFDSAIVPKDRAGYWNDLSLAQKINLPTESMPIMSSDEKTSAWVEDSTVYVKDNTGDLTRKKVSYFEKEIKSVEFLPNRNDVIMVAVDNGVYAIETDTNTPQNFQPIYIGIKPSFHLNRETKELFIADNGNLLRIQL